jgi:hypothetical protein
MEITFFIGVLILLTGLIYGRCIRAIGARLSRSSRIRSFVIAMSTIKADCEPIPCPRRRRG